MLNKDNGLNSLANKSNETMQHFNVCKNIDDASESPLNQKNINLQYFDTNCKVTLKFKNNLLKLIANYEDIFKGHGKLKKFSMQTSCRRKHTTGCAKFTSLSPSKRYSNRIKAS